jgi:predicted small secreted protein
MKKLLGLLAIAAIAAVLTGCNTMEGFGKDIKKVGDQIEDSARKK